MLQLNSGCGAAMFGTKSGILLCISMQACSDSGHCFTFQSTFKQLYLLVAVVQERAGAAEA